MLRLRNGATHRLKNGSIQLGPCAPLAQGAGDSSGANYEDNEYNNKISKSIAHR